MSASPRTMFIPNSANDPRCLDCRMKHCFQCEHRPIDIPVQTPRARRLPPVKAVYQAPKDAPKKEPKKKKCCCC